MQPAALPVFSFSAHSLYTKKMGIPYRDTHFGFLGEAFAEAPVVYRVRKLYCSLELVYMI